MSPTTIGGSAGGIEDSFGQSTARHFPPPFYAIAMQGWTLVSFAGLKVNTELQVINVEHRTIPNLYAIGGDRRRCHLRSGVHQHAGHLPYIWSVAGLEISHPRLACPKSLKSPTEWFTPGIIWKIWWVTLKNSTPTARG